MLYADALRGHHSTGIFTLTAGTITAADQNFKGKVEKEAGTAYNVLKKVGSKIDTAINTRVGLVMGHNR